MPSWEQTPDDSFKLQSSVASAKRCCFIEFSVVKLAGGGIYTSVDLLFLSVCRGIIVSV